MSRSLSLAAISLFLSIGLSCGEEVEGDDAGECDDGADNDQNGDFDCDDAGCAGSPLCAGSEDSTIDEDEDGYSPSDGDCDDANGEVNPGVTEVPYDGVDNDCSADTPDDDVDGDGFVVADDCNDNDATMAPGLDEACDGVDNNCDGLVGDEEDDVDGDGFKACDDCDDTDNDKYPGAPLGCDGTDWDCDEVIDNDDDFDGYSDVGCGGSDCDDANSAIPLPHDTPDPGANATLETCHTGELHCGDVVTHSTMGGLSELDREYYEDVFCLGAYGLTTDYDGAERVYLVHPEGTGSKVVLTYDCGDFALRSFYTGTETNVCPTPGALNEQCEAGWEVEDGMRERPVGEWVAGAKYQVVVDGIGHFEGVYTLELICE